MLQTHSYFHTRGHKLPGIITRPVVQWLSQKRAEHNSWAFCNTQEINKANVPSEHITDLILCVLHGNSFLNFLPFFFNMYKH